ncbi:MAG: lactoylglutathione lyase [Sphingomonadales bacterium]|nr:lactoylglutathione lyase [Sphingomonadales bacterium]
MTKMIFISLPVTDLERSKAFYTALGFVNEPRFSDHTSAAMQWSEHIVLMIMIRTRWADFTDRPIPPAGSSEVMNCLSCDSREAVDAMNQAAVDNGGTGDINPIQDHGTMYGRDFADPDGHAWGGMWMDPAVASGDAPPPAA